MKELILAKLGGSLITDKSRPYTVRMDVMKRLALEIHEARKEKDFSLILGHGGGSFPHQSASKYQTHKGIINSESYRGIAVVQNDASKLNRIFVEELIAAGENAISIQPSAAGIAESGKIVDFRLDSIERALEFGMLPVPYGDVMFDLKQGCCIISTEEILNFVANKMKPQRIIVAGEVDGVFTADPTKDKNAEFIPEVNKKNFEEIKKYLGGSAGVDVTGGMLHKIEEMMELAELGFESQIINATKPGILKRALLGENVGTRIW